MSDLSKLQERLASQRKCIRCDCIACGREGAGELHDHVCTDGEGCLETQEKLRHRVQMLRYLCGDAADALREAASRLQAPAVAEVEVKPTRCEDCNGTGLALNIRGEPDDCRHCDGGWIVE